MDLSAEIAKMATSLLEKPSHFIVDVIISGNRVQKKVVIILDGDEGVNIESCAKLSRSLSEKLDEQSLIEENYTLEVSTPGVDFPLKLKRQYKKHIGRGFKITRKDKSLITGKLIAMEDEMIQVEVEEKAGKGKKKEVKIMDIPLDSIDKAFVQISFK